MKTNTQLLKIILGLSISFLLGYSLSTTRSLSREIKQTKSLRTSLDSLSKISDSLNQENFRISIDLGRYEHALYMLEDSDPKSAKAFNEALSNTE